ncbi:MAG: hypothetical protein K0M70_01950 [Arenimonas sp.]|uniref:hypothetical protein n=1 Tax=Arenimonas sp. TaxID=1872635 RepID=UPI0025BD7F4E|nr:hypothetical protein [Arenimonas sp.]MBW8366605.1 hypothetical protein [Arenimonas sp.]
MAIAISLFAVFISLFVVMMILKRGSASTKAKSRQDGSTTSVGGDDAGGSRKGAADSGGQDGGGDGGGD